MKILKTVLFFLFISLSDLASDSTKVEFKRFTFGIFASPDLDYRNLTANTQENYPQVSYYNRPYPNNYYNTAIDRNKIEIPKLGFTVGTNLSYYFMKHFALSLGASFARKGYCTRDSYYGTSRPKGNFERYQFNYIEIPLKANFNFGKKKIRFVVSAGATSAFLLYEQTSVRQQTLNFGKKRYKDIKYSFNSFNLFPTGSIGIEFKIAKKIRLQIEPTFSYGLMSTINSYYDENLWSAGLNIGCYIPF